MGIRDGGNGVYFIFPLQGGDWGLVLVVHMIFSVSFHMSGIIDCCCNDPLGINKILYNFGQTQGPKSPIIVDGGSICSTF